MRIISIDLSYDVYERNAFDGIYYHMGTNKMVVPWGFSFSIISGGVYERGDKIIETHAFIVASIIAQNRKLVLPRVCIYKNRLHDQK